MNVSNNMSVSNIEISVQDRRALFANKVRLVEPMNFQMTPNPLNRQNVCLTGFTTTDSQVCELVPLEE